MMKEFVFIELLTIPHPANYRYKGLYLSDDTKFKKSIITRPIQVCLTQGFGGNILYRIT